VGGLPGVCDPGLGEYDIVYLFIDGIAERIRPGQKREPVLAAWGFTATGAKEDAETVGAFFQEMRARGLGDPLLVVSDGAPGIIKAIETCIAHLRIPVDHRRAIRTTNLLERLFVEERRRLKIIPNAFGEKPVLKLMFSAMIRTAERWRAIRVTDFERRQMEAVRKELDHEYEARNGLVPKTSANADQTKLSSTSRTRP
jgi:transposase-like protein